MGAAAERPLRFATVVAGLAAAAMAGVALSPPPALASASASASQVRVGTFARLPERSRTLGALPASQRLALTVALRSRDAAGLRALATAVSSPGSPRFRQYLTERQFAQRFGAGAGRVANVVSALRARGLVVGVPAADELTIPVTGTAAQVQRALSIRLDRVRLSGGRIAYANAQAPALPASVAGAVAGVVGLDDLSENAPEDLAADGRARGGARSSEPSGAGGLRPDVATGGPVPCAQATQAAQGANAAAGHGYTADTIASAYQLPQFYFSGDEGAGQTIALFEQGPYDPRDIAAYQLCYGTSVPVTNVDVDGGPGAYVPGASDDGEAALDIEQVIGLAPKVGVRVYEGPDTGSATIDILSEIVSDDAAKVISDSFGSCEPLAGATRMNAENTLLQEAATQGQTFLAASGDSGSAACYQQNKTTALSVVDPASQPYATAVGGTTLYTTIDGHNYLYAAGDTPAEAVWNEGVEQGTALAGGGGLSTRWAMPSYQSGTPAWLGVLDAYSHDPACAAALCREVPDVSAEAATGDGYVIDANGAWEIVGGTSASTPVWAAFTALADASPTCQGKPLGFENPSLYATAAAAYTNNFRDPSTALSGAAASNDALQVNGGLYPVTPGYDLATGLGTPLGPRLGATLCGGAPPAYTVTVTGPGDLSSALAQSVSLTVHAADSAEAQLSFAASGLPAGLSIDPTTGLISGVLAKAGTTTVTVTAGDVYANVGSATFRWAVAGPPAPVLTAGEPRTGSAKLSGLGDRDPRLSFALRAGAHAPALRSVAIKLPAGLSFAGSARVRARGLAVRSGAAKLPFSAALHRGVLTITFHSVTRSAALTVERPAVTISLAEAARVRRHRVTQLTFGLTTTDTSRRSTRITVTFTRLS